MSKPSSQFLKDHCLQGGRSEVPGRSTLQFIRNRDTKKLTHILQSAQSVSRAASGLSQ